MSAKAIHLNLLHDSERLSSSPVRTKVMLPLIAGGALAAMILWWVFLLLQVGLIGSEVRSLRSEVAASERTYGEVLKLKETLASKTAELDQCKGYLNARHRWGGVLAAVAEAVPPGIQLGMIEIPEPPQQNLQPPPGIKRPPLLGPTNEVEDVTFRIAGKTAREAHVFDFLDAIRGSASCTNNLLIAKGNGSGAGVSPKMRQFGQDREVGDSGVRAIVFDVEYATSGRRFAP